jgi:hypothetical protein
VGQVLLLMLPREHCWGKGRMCHKWSLRNWVKLSELALALIYSVFCVQIDEPNKLPLISKLLLLEAR